jgi:predicted nucleotidyltransferase
MDKTLRKIVCKIQACIGNQLDFIVLFGSRAHGTFLPISDIDLGVKVSVAETGYGRLQLELAGLFAFDALPRIDIVLVDAASLTLKYRVVRDGRLLYQRTPEVWPTFVEEVLTRYPDWKIYLDHYLTEAIGA